MNKQLEAVVGYGYSFSHQILKERFNQELISGENYLPQLFSEKVNNFNLENGYDLEFLHAKNGSIEDSHYLILLKSTIQKLHEPGDLHVAGVIRFPPTETLGLFKVLRRIDISPQHQATWIFAGVERKRNG